MGMKRQTGNMFWQLLLKQKLSIQEGVKEEMEVYNYYRMFRDYYAFEEPKTMKFGIRTLDIFFRIVLPEKYKQLVGLTTFEQLERYYSDITND